MVHSEVHLERYLSQFFEISSIAKESMAGCEDSFASADCDTEVSLKDDMQALAKLIQESWAEFGGEDEFPILKSPASPYFTSGPQPDLENLEQRHAIDISDYTMDESMGTMPQRLFN